MKTAIICDWLVTLGGAEKVLGEILQCFSHADLYAVIDFLPQAKRDFLLHKSSTTTFIQKLPFAKKRYRSYLPLMPLAIEQLDLSRYDLIISSSHAVAKGVITAPHQLHISYVHSPMRYAWDLQHQYLRETGLDKNMLGWFARYWLHKLRLWDLRSANGVDHFIANSNYVAKRIEKTYRRKAHVIHPSVDTAQFQPGTKKEEYYLAASRFVPYKRIDMIVECFNNMPDKKLVVIGDGPDFTKIKSKAKSNVSLLGYQPTPVLIEHLQSAQAFIFAALEDFGILPLEAQSCGTPVIAYGQGGALETVRGLESDAPTGVFFPHQTPDSLRRAIKIFEANRDVLTKENCIQQATQFSQAVFRQKFTQFVQEKWHSSASRNHSL